MLLIASRRYEEEYVYVEVRRFLEACLVCEERKRDEIMLFIDEEFQQRHHCFIGKVNTRSLNLLRFAGIKSMYLFNNSNEDFTFCY